jgi:hypothetical protein
VRSRCTAGVSHLFRCGNDHSDDLARMHRNRVTYHGWTDGRWLTERRAAMQVQSCHCAEFNQQLNTNDARGPPYGHASAPGFPGAMEHGARHSSRRNLCERDGSMPAPNRLPGMAIGHRSILSCCPRVWSRVGGSYGTRIRRPGCPSTKAVLLGRISSMRH